MRGRIQRYEGASTLYGPHTLAAYINVTLSWISSLSPSAISQPPKGPEPPNNTNRSLSFIPSVVYDAPPIFKNFGDVLQDVEAIYRRGDKVKATFVAANPRNNLRLESTYAVVERRRTQMEISEELDHEEGLRKGRASDNAWDTVRSDNDWHLVFRWQRKSELLATSEAEITWETEPWATPGKYRIRYQGDAKSLGGSIDAFEGVSSEFSLAA